MALGKQAKVLSKGQIDGALGYIAKTRHPVRNRVDIPPVSEGGIACEGDCVAHVGHGDRCGRRGRSINPPAE